jgi:hypothetical protein
MDTEKSPDTRAYNHALVDQLEAAYPGDMKLAVILGVAEGGTLRIGVNAGLDPKTITQLLLSAIQQILEHTVADSKMLVNLTPGPVN